MNRSCTAESGRKPKVLMYYSYGNKVGGPLTYINTIIASELKEKYDFVTCYQNKAPGGLDLQLLRDMTEAIRREQPDIVHVHGAQSEGFYGVLAAKRAGCKQIVMAIHGFAHDDSNCRGVKHFLYKNIIEPLSIRMSDQVYCVCEFASKRPIVVRNAGKRNRGYIHNPVPELKPQEDRASIRSRYGIAEDETVFAIAGRVTRDKGFDVLAQAVKLLNAQGKRFRLMVLGDGVYHAEFSRIMAEEIAAGQVIMVGRTDRVADYLFASDAFVFPSYHENLSIALLEACAAKLPCIVANVGGNPEIVKDQKNGYVIEGFAPEDFADRMGRMIDDPDLRAQLGQEAQRDILERFSLSRMCGKIDEVYSRGIEA